MYAEGITQLPKKTAKDEEATEYERATQVEQEKKLAEGAFYHGLIECQLQCVSACA